MTITLLSILAATAAGGVLSVLLSATLALTVLHRLVPWLVSVAVGVMLTFALTDMIPEAAALGLAPDAIGRTLLLGLFVFFLLEKVALWRHAHAAGAPAHQPATASLIVIGDGVHNFVDGVLIAAAFRADPALGWTTAAAVIAHEVSQELSDIGVLLNSGLSRMRAVLLNALSGLAMVIGGLAGYVAFNKMQALLPYAITVAAASFLYIAVADLVPLLHRRTAVRDGLVQSACIASGSAVALVGGLLH
jgi:zinc and cadmium transporter